MGNLRSRIDSLEQAQGMGERLVITVRHFGTFPEGRGVICNGTFHRCPSNTSIDELALRVIDDAKRTGRGPIILVRADGLE